MVRRLLVSWCLAFAAASYVRGEPCSLTIKVIDAERGKPLPGAEVVVQPPDSQPPPITSLTDSSGNAYFHELVSGAKYYVEARFPTLLFRSATVTCTGGAAPHEIALPKSMRVSLVTLLADPSKWHRRQVQVVGFLNLQFEGDALYLHRDDWEHAIYLNAIWVNTGDGKCQNWKQLNRKYVYLEGSFDASRNGHMGAFAGELSEITRCGATP